jgi:hypothetical protein
VSDNGLRKRCLNLEIPLPPRGYWAKVKAGLQVPPKPALPTLKVKTQAIVLKDANREQEIEFIDISGQSTEVLKNLDGMGYFTNSLKKILLSGAGKLKFRKKLIRIIPWSLNIKKK